MPPEPRLVPVPSDLDERLRPPRGGPELIDPYSESWQSGWAARAMQADVDCADAYATGYTLGQHDAERDRFVTTAVVITIMVIVAFVLGVALS